ncbi:MAG TPA: HD domain-containing phosphohydrolase [Blastocatellia bacterium]|nr:HD domain-containing phosphohydrolase [Blastocatellia bacterium]
METAKGKTREQSINKLADSIDRYEKYSHPHTHLMAELAALLARRLGLTQNDIRSITEAALLHDIGLQAMAPPYYLRDSPLTFEERMDLWRHPIIGEQQMAKHDATRHAQLLVRWHHEWWNGTGYPDMLAFEDIPIGARILRAVELYSALVSDRPYRAALDANKALETLKASAGVECDPYIVKALVALIEEMLAPVSEPEAATVEESPSIISEQPKLSASEPIDSSVTAETSGVESTLPPDSMIPEPNGPRAGIEAETSEPDQEQSIATPSGVSTIESTFVTSNLAQAEENASNESEPATESAPVTFESELMPEKIAETAVAEQAHPATEESRSPVELLLKRAKDFGEDEATWRGWGGSRYNRKLLLGFEASVLRQIEFRTIAMPFCASSRLDWYLKAWGKYISINDPRAWASMIARATVEAKEPLGEDTIVRILDDVYVPRARLANAELRRWFSETDAWWMDNLRHNIESLDDEVLRAQAIMLGIQTGDYALSFNEETRELRQPLTTVFWRLAGRAVAGHAGHLNNRAYNMPVEDFIKRSRVDLLYLNLPAAHAERAGEDARSDWRECWVQGRAVESADDLIKIAVVPQSKQSFLACVDRLLKAGLHIRQWAIEFQEIGIASASDIAEVIQEYRPVRATYSKDVTEVAGGLRNYIIVAEKVS